MISVYKELKDIPKDSEYIEINDIFFNQHTAMKIDERAADIINRIDNSKLISKFKIESRFDNIVLNIDKLSSGCKTALNVLYFPDKVFCVKECGENALSEIYSFEEGKIYSNYPMIPFDMKKVLAVTSEKSLITEDYEELKEWWNHED